MKNSSTVFAHALTNLATNSLMASACEVAGPWANLTLKSSKTATLHPTIPLNGHHSLPASSDGNGGTAMRENTLPTGVGTVVDTIAIDTATMNYSAATFAAFASPTGFMALTVKRACVPSFARGTAIRVPDGEQAAEALAIGDLVETRDGARPVKWIGRRAYAGRFADANPAILPVCIKAGAMADGVPHRDLTVSPQHAVLIDGVMVAAIHLVNGVSVVQAERVDAIEYLHIELEQHNAIWAEGALSETFADADSRATFHNVHEYATLYGTEPGSWPGSSPSLCAPRLEQGYALDALRRRIALRAGIAQDDVLGPARGFVDVVEPDNVQGWAQDERHPEVPVCVDVLIDGEIVAQALADGARPDLARAGFGSGRHGFHVALPPVAPGAPGAVTVRRSADGAILLRSGLSRAA